MTISVYANDNKRELLQRLLKQHGSFTVKKSKYYL